MNIFSFLVPKEDTYFIDSDSTIRQALEKFDFYKFTVVPTVDDEGHYVGTVSEGDILRFIKNNAKFNIAVAEHYRISELEKYRSYKALDITCTENDLFELSLEQNFIPLVDGRGMYIGIIKRKDVIKYLYTKAKEAL